MTQTVACFIRCAFCGDVLDRFEIPVGGRWDQAEKWGYVATKAHQPVCPGRVAPLSALVLR